jgi:hypothetical protein
MFVGSLAISQRYISSSVVFVLDVDLTVQKARSEHSRAPEWHLGPSGIRLEHLFLVSLVNVFEDAWQADIAVDF